MSAPAYYPLWNENMNISWHDYSSGGGGSAYRTSGSVANTLDFYFTFRMGRPGHADLVLVTTSTNAVWGIPYVDYNHCTINGQDATTIT